MAQDQGSRPLGHVQGLVTLEALLTLLSVTEDNASCQATALEEFLLAHHDSYVGAQKNLG